MELRNKGSAEAYAPIVEALESQIMELDAMGAHYAAAYIDAAIHQLRLHGTQPPVAANA